MHSFCLIQPGSVHTLRFPLIGKNRSIFIGNLAKGLFWIYFYRLMGNA
jgi:hypothetical protein